ncbi:MAG: endolytic transglycosylase MltG [Pyrinomonadaceae bacterium]
MKLFKILLSVIVVIGLIFAAAAYWLFSSLSTPVQHGKANQTIVIEKGSTPTQIVANLAQEGILSGDAAVLLYLRIFGGGEKMQAGEYQFKSPISPLEVLEELKTGETRSAKMTIPEGFTRFDIAQRISALFPQNPPVDEKQVLALMDDTSLIRDISPTAENLEGYMYPSTYNIPTKATPREIIEITVEQFRKFWRPEWTEKARSMGRTPHEIVTIASLIETETGVERERPIVAGIINNRLSRNIPLGIDQTNVYIAKTLGKWDGTIHKSDLEVDSPYNTRTKTGLPPGPISSVTESSIRAALNPQPNDYLYYVRNVDLNDGSHWFYSSAAEFEKGKARYQQWLEKERQAERVNPAGSQ